MGRPDGEGERRGIFAFGVERKFSVSFLFFRRFCGGAQIFFVSITLFFLPRRPAFPPSKKERREKKTLSLRKNKMSKPGGRSALTAALTGTGGEGAEAAPASAAGSHFRLDAAAFPCLASVLGKSSKPVLAGAAAAAAAGGAAADTVGELSSGFERVKLRGNDALAGSAPTAHLLPDGSAAVSVMEAVFEIASFVAFFSLASKLFVVTYLGHALFAFFHASPRLLLPRRDVVALIVCARGAIESN